MSPIVVAQSDTAGNLRASVMSDLKRILWSSLLHNRKHRAHYDLGSARKQTLKALGLSVLIFAVVDGNLFINGLRDIDQAFWNFDAAEAHPQALRIQVNAHQWAWDFRYAGPDGKFNNQDDIVTTNDLRVPIGVPVVLQLAASDVLHSFSLPHFRVKQDGSFTYDDTGQDAPQFGASFTDTFASAQSGWYTQGVWQFMPRWRVGYRYDRLDHGTVSNALGLTSGILFTEHNPTRHTAMVDWSLSEFSRIRLQLASDKSRAGVTDNQALLQVIFSLGAHGAHTF